MPPKKTKLRVAGNASSKKGYSIGVNKNKFLDAFEEIEAFNKAAVRLGSVLVAKKCMSPSGDDEIDVPLCDERVPMWTRDATVKAVRDLFREDPEKLRDIHVASVEPPTLYWNVIWHTIDASVSEHTFAAHVRLLVPDANWTLLEGRPKRH